MIPANFRGVKMTVPAIVRDGYYKKALGMIDAPQGSAASSSTRLTFKGQARGQFLELNCPDGTKEGDFPEDGAYWKCGILTPDAAALCEHLNEEGFKTFRKPHQFNEIGFLSHGRDISGMTTEVLQHTFESTFKTLPKKPFSLDDVTLGQLTISTRDIHTTLKFWEDALDMVVLSHQAVPENGFALYFLSGRDCGMVEDEDDPNKVELREALWQKPFATLEIRYSPKGERYYIQYEPPLEGASGFEGIVLGIPKGTKDAMLAQIKQVTGIEPKADGILYDPNKIPVFFDEQ